MGKTKNIVIIAGILIALSLAGFFIYKDFKSSKENKNNENVSEEQNISGGILEENSDDDNSSEAEQIQEDITDSVLETNIQKIKIPDLSKDPVVKADLPENIKKKTIEEIEALTNSLKKNYDSPTQWIQLGLLKKLLGDFEGAKIAWEFAAEIRPKDSISRHNLGNLYWQNFRDFRKAEENYLESLELNKQDISAYIDVSNIYYYDLKNISKAKEILMKGLKANPENQELLRALKEIK